MRWLLSTMALLCSSWMTPTGAFAQSWTAVQVADGTVDGPHYVAAAIRQWGPTEEVFVVYEERSGETPPDPVGGDPLPTHDLYLKWYANLCDISGQICNWQCAAGFGCPPEGINPPSDTVHHDQARLPSIGLDREGPNEPRQIEIVARNKTLNDCDGDGVAYPSEPFGDIERSALDLAHWTWDTDGGLVGSSVSNNLPQTCDDRGVSFTLNDGSGDPQTCWTHKQSSSLDEIRCSGWNGSGWDQPSQIITNVAPNNVEFVQEHPWMLMHGGDRYIAQRSKEGNGVVRMRQIDNAADPLVAFGGGGEGPNYPAMGKLTNPDRLVVVWHVLDPAGGISTVEYVECELSTGCDDQADWGPIEVVHTGELLRHASFASDGDNQFVVYMEDLDPTPDTDYRVYLKARCEGDSWPATGELLRTPVDADWDQSMAFGRPNLVVSRQNDMVHVAFVELEVFNNQAAVHDGDVWWLRRSYTECP